MPSRPRRRSGLPRPVRVALIVFGVVFVFLFLSMWGIARFYTDYLWFDALDYGSVWRSILFTKVALAVVFMGVFFIGMWFNLWIADRIAPPFRPSGPEEELLRRYHDAVGGRAGLLRVGIAAIFALMVGAGAAGQWDSWLLFTNAVDVGVDDPQFGQDVGFYLFRLPMITFVVNWAFRTVLIILFVTAVAHYVNGGIRAQTPGQIVAPQVKAHLSVLLALLALIKSVDYWYDRYGLTVSTRGAVDGATYTDVNAQLPAIQLLLLISLLAVVVFLVNIWRRGWVLPLAAVGLWAFVAVVMGAIFPAIYQRLRVEPSESAREETFIVRNIEATREAFGLDVEVQAYPYSPELTAADLASNEETIRNIRLLDPSIVQNTYEQIEAERDFYKFNDLDVDRYDIDGTPTQVVVGARTVDPGNINEPSWENETLGFTHGYGVALSPANGVDASGRPDFLIEGVPQTNNLGILLDQPQLYIGEGLGGYSIVNTEREEIDFVSDDGTTVNNRYDGEGGVEVGGTLRKFAFALRFADINPLISGQVNSDSRVIYVRDVRDRVEMLAPFLEFDSDPYPVISDGRIVYIVDAYTASSHYPYSQRADTDSLPDDSGLARRFNYVRNSVKAVVDGYDGTVTFYVIDETDPVIQVWQKAFPDLFSPFDEMPSDLVEHFRYPEDLFRVQTNMWARYHITNPVSFYGRENEWEVAQDPGEAIVASQADVEVVDPEVTPDAFTPTDEGRIDPYYVLLRLPDEAVEEFVILRSFVPQSSNDSRPELTAFMVARSDPERYGELVVYEMPGTEVDGPLNVNSNILTEETIADRITQLNQQGSQVRLANLLLLPIEDSILYVRPLYVQAEAETAQIPELKAVIVAHDDQVVIDATLQGALEQLFGAAPETLQEEPDDQVIEAPEPDEPDASDAEPAPTPSPETDEPVAVPDDVSELLARASELFDEADVALRDADLATYQEKTQEAAELIDQAAALLEDAIVDTEGDDLQGSEASDTGPDDEPTPDSEPA